MKTYMVAITIIFGTLIGCMQISRKVTRAQQPEVFTEVLTQEELSDLVTSFQEIPRDQLWFHLSAHLAKKGYLSKPEKLREIDKSISIDCNNINCSLNERN